MSTIQQLADQMAEQFTSSARDNGETYYHLKDGHPEWMTDVIHEVHGGLLPDDFTYETIRDCAVALSECDTDADEDTLNEAIQEMEPEHRTYQLYQWAAQFSEYIDEAISEFGAHTIENTGDLFNLLQMGQKCHIESVGYALIRVLSVHVDGSDGPMTTEKLIEMIDSGEKAMAYSKLSAGAYFVAEKYDDGGYSLSVPGHGHAQHFTNVNDLIVFMLEMSPLDTWF